MRILNSAGIDTKNELNRKRQMTRERLKKARSFRKHVIKKKYANT